MKQRKGRIIRKVRPDMRTRNSLDLEKLFSVNLTIDDRRKSRRQEIERLEEERRSKRMGKKHPKNRYSHFPTMEELFQSEYA